MAFIKLSWAFYAKHHLDEIRPCCEGNMKIMVFIAKAVVVSSNHYIWTWKGFVSLRWL